ncbi:C40 family peptidase [Nocardioides euryhalodurans]|uniref:NlpC/P60 family protein n=1 Tax=Nocardioides euryhalodurans TaxID=2518370 RepID=A0A4P7GL69_9ACTN|nr:C40 family peptidase [Nocardioides euryhalodurans]QBR92579.1 NlpC/P60 family protein [Nocardioides euryhalodurans]
MRAVGSVLVLTLALAVPPAAGGMAWADGTDAPPTRSEVRDARAAVRDQTRDVATVQAELLAANQRLQDSAMRAAQASEAWNGARYRLEQARRAAAAAADRAGIARQDVDAQRQAYADAVVESYQMAPELTAVASIVQSDGIASVVEQTTTLGQTEAAMDTRYDGFRAASTLAGVAVVQATDARTEAEQLQVEAREARDAAVAAADAAAAEAQSIAERKGVLIEELARLEDVSVEIAEERQSALEAQALAEAAAEQRAAQEAAAAEQAAEQAEQDAADEASQPAPAPAPSPAPEPQPEPDPAPQPPPAPPAPPAPSGGVGAAISFARAQIGEPYQWGAAGPSAWDCSGLTMGAWSAGGRSLPHYSVAQYEQSTPIGVGNLQPGDLLFWGSSNSPSSIYHVALYVGSGQMIHAPRTGRPVTQESMYYWTAPNFFARP